MLLPLLLGSAFVFQDRPPVAGDRVEPFTLSGGSYEPGRTTVITVWAYWCETWKTQDQRMQEVVRSAKGLPVDFLAISIDGRWTDLTKPPTWARLLTDRGAEWSRRLSINRVPYTLVLGPDGVVRWAKDGVVRVADVMRAIRSDSSPEGGSVYLTFDDFPSGKKADHDLLDILRASEVRASFFCIGDNLRAHPEIARRAAREGHGMEIHGLHHTGDTNPSACAKIIDEITGFKGQWVRLPGTSAVKSLDGKTTFPGKTVNPYDYRRPGQAELMRRILNNLRPDVVIQLHAGVEETVAAMPEIIREAEKRNLQMKPID